MKSSCNAFAVLMAALCTASTAAALPLTWRADWPDAKPVETLVHRGTDIELQPTWFINKTAADTNGWTFTTFCQTNAVGPWFGPLPGAAFSHTNDVGAAFYNVMVRAQTPGGHVNYTAFARLRMLDSPGFAPGELPLPVSTIDFSQVVAVNAPWLLPAATNDIGTIKVELESISNSVSTLSAAAATNTAAIATLKDTTATNSAAITTINSKIPSAASASNQLADKQWIDDEIDTYAAYYITYTAAGAAFPTRAALLNATVVYSVGVARTPTRNDYAVVLADESHGGAEWRYIYTVAAGATSGQWDAQYPIETNDYDGLSNKPQINGNTLTGNKTAAQLGVASTADATLTERGYNAWATSQTGEFNGEPWYYPTPTYGGNGTWYMSQPMSADAECSGGADATSLTFIDDDCGGGVITFTRTALPGYILGAQANKPLAAAEMAITNSADIAALASRLTQVSQSATNYTDASISPTSPAFSNAVLSVGLGINTNTVAAINELVDSAHDLPVTGATSVGALLLALAAAVAALKKRLPYALVAKTIENGAVTLDDRASNAVEISEVLSPNTLTINFPTATSGKVRDFALRLDIASGVTAPELVLPQGVVCENADGEVPEISDGGTGGSSTILYFSETENNGTTAKFLLKGETLAAITQA